MHDNSQRKYGINKKLHSYLYDRLYHRPVYALSLTDTATKSSNAIMQRPFGGTTRL